MKKTNLLEVQINLKTLPAYVQKLISELLYVEDFTRKHNARITLVKMGKRVIPSMHKLLSSKNNVLRTEAAKVIELIADKRSIPYLITLMDDPVFDIRWIAAEGLIRIGRKSIRPLLRSICGVKSTLFLDKSAHHVLGKLLHEEEKLELNTLMQSLDNFHETGETAPAEAFKALKMLRYTN
jgi:HEAT repeat protein